jgi:hypothetical protein
MVDGLTLPQAYALLLLRSDGAFVTTAQWFDAGLAGAVLGDLALRGVITLTRGRVVSRKSGPLGDAVLDDIRMMIDTSSAPRRPTSWISRFGNRTLRESVMYDLAQRGLVERHERRVLGLFPVVRWPERDGGPEKHLRGELAEVLHGIVPPTRFAIALIGLLRATSTLRSQFGAVDRRFVRELTRNDWVGAAVETTIQRVKSSVLDGGVPGAGGGGGGGD